MKGAATKRTHAYARPAGTSERCTSGDAVVARGGTTSPRRGHRSALNARRRQAQLRRVAPPGCAAACAPPRRRIRSAPGGSTGSARGSRLSPSPPSAAVLNDCFAHRRGRRIRTGLQAKAKAKIRTKTFKLSCARKGNEIGDALTFAVRRLDDLALPERFRARPHRRPDLLLYVGPLRAAPVPKLARRVQRRDSGVRALDRRARHTTQRRALR